VSGRKWPLPQLLLYIVLKIVFSQIRIANYFNGPFDERGGGESASFAGGSVGPRGRWDPAWLLNARLLLGFCIKRGVQSSIAPHSPLTYIISAKQSYGVRGPGSSHISSTQLVNLPHLCEAELRGLGHGPSSWSTVHMYCAEDL
jgi:hypothetical protein